MRRWPVRQRSRRSRCRDRLDDAVAGMAAFPAESLSRSPMNDDESMIALSMRMAPAAAILSIIVERLCGGVRSEIAFLAVNDAVMLARL